MTAVVLAALAAAWVAYFALWVRDRRVAAPDRRNSTRDFKRFLSALDSPAEEPQRRWRDALDAPRTRQAAMRRRRHVIMLVAAVAAVSLSAVPAVGAIAVAVHLLADAALIAIVSAEARRRRVAAERVAKVRVLYPDRPTPEFETVRPLRRTGSG